MIQFYAPDILTDPVLPESDSQHCVKVLRKQVGDEIEVIDGKGHRYKCVLIDAHPKHAMVEIADSCDVPLSWQQHITVAVAPTKHLDRMEWMVEKLVEIGVNRIVPLRCRWSERKELKEERLRKIAVSAMKQSLKAVLTEVYPMTPIKEFITNYESDQKYIAYCSQSIPRCEFAKVYKPGGSVAVMIGPEGDFDESEIVYALDKGFRPVTFGENRLRTETAALYAGTAIHVMDSMS